MTVPSDSESLEIPDEIVSQFIDKLSSSVQRRVENLPDLYPKYHHFIFFFHKYND